MYSIHKEDMKIQLTKTWKKTKKKKLTIKTKLYEKKE